MKENQTKLNEMKKERFVVFATKKRKEMNTQMQYGNPLVNEPLRFRMGSNLKICYRFNFYPFGRVHIFCTHTSAHPPKDNEFGLNDNPFDRLDCTFVSSAFDIKVKKFQNHFDLNKYCFVSHCDMV